MFKNKAELPKIAIIGYGQMGKEINILARENNFEVTDIFDLDNVLNDTKDYEFDVAIDFSFPKSAIKNALILSSLGKNIVMGTTGWYDDAETMKKIISENNNGFVWGSNFSVGVQLFFRIIENAAKIIDKFDNFDLMLHEMHHRRKKDSPSGTAETLADIILQNVARKTSLETNAINGEVDEAKLHVSSTRGGEITGRHTLYIDSISDSIELSHRAKNRKGFAMGSLVAAKWIHNKKGYFQYNQVIDDILL